MLNPWAELTGPLALKNTGDVGLMELYETPSAPVVPTFKLRKLKTKFAVAEGLFPVPNTICIEQSSGSDAAPLKKLPRTPMAVLLEFAPAVAGMVFCETMSSSTVSTCWNSLSAVQVLFSPNRLGNPTMLVPLKPSDWPVEGAVAESGMRVAPK